MEGPHLVWQLPQLEMDFAGAKILCSKEDQACSDNEKNEQNRNHF